MLRPVSPSMRDWQCPTPPWHPLGCLDRGCSEGVCSDLGCYHWAEESGRAGGGPCQALRCFRGCGKWLPLSDAQRPYGTRWCLCHCQGSVPCTAACGRWDAEALAGPAGFGRVWQGPAGFGRFWQSLARSSRVWQVLAGFGRVQQALVGSGRLWQALAGSGRIWQGLAGSAGRRLGQEPHALREEKLPCGCAAASRGLSHRQSCRSL